MKNGDTPSLIQIILFQLLFGLKNLSCFLSFISASIDLAVMEWDTVTSFHLKKKKCFYSLVHEFFIRPQPELVDGVGMKDCWCGGFQLRSICHFLLKD